MNILEVIPALEGIIGKVIQDPNQAGNLKLELEKLDVQKDIEKMKTQQSWMNNKSVYVAGAIPTILWMVSFVIAFNHILAPILKGIGMDIPILELPNYYTDLAATIVVGLFVKKGWESAEISAIGKKPKVEEHPPAPVASSSIPKSDPQYHDKRYQELIDKYGLEQSNEKIS